MRSKLFIVLCACFPLLSAGQTADQILKNYFNSVGGVDAIRKYTSSSSRSLIIQRIGKRDTTLVEHKTKLPSSFHHSVYKAGRLTSEIYGNAKSVTKLSYKPYFDQVENSSARIHISDAHELLLAFDKHKLKREADTTINNEAVYAIKTRLRKKDLAVNKVYYFEKKSWHLVASSFETMKDDLFLFENYTAQGDLMVPMKTSILLKGIILNELHIQSLEINPTLHDSLFVAKPNPIASAPAFKLSKRIEYLDPAFADTDLNVLTEPFRGKLVLIDLWASWCGPCKSEFSRYDDAFYHYLKSKNIEMVYVNFNTTDKATDWKNAIDQFSLNGYHIRAEKKLKQSIKQKVFEGEEMFIPRLILIGKDGEIISTQLPKLSSGFFYSKIDELVNTITP